jgi:hypothetical protein
MELKLKYSYIIKMISDSPKTNILIEPTEDLTISRENILHISNLDRIQELERKLEVENTWNSCCLKTDRRAVIYFTSFSLSASVLVLCIYQLLTKDDCNSNQLFLGLLTFILGVYFPNPKIQK